MNRKKGWTKSFSGYINMIESEIDDVIHQVSAEFMLRIWEEVSRLFLEFMTKSTHSPYYNVKAKLTRRGQSNSEN